jgi:colanic acid/amylovoran biosynthesis protein
MRVLVDTVSDAQRNIGNVALLQIAIERLGTFWPQASLEVITASPYLLKLYCPKACPVSPNNQYDWTKDSTLLDTIIRRMPTSLLQTLLVLREEIWNRWPTLNSILSVKKLKSLFRPEASQVNPIANPSEDRQKADIRDHASGNNDFRMLEGIDLFVVSGAQHISDAVMGPALRTLDRLELATQLGIPTVMVGQGIGPIHNPKLLRRATKILPLIDLIFVRDSQPSIPLLKSMGVNAQRIFFTGDDALEMAYRARIKSYGSSIGLSVRLAGYTGMDTDHLKILKKVSDHVTQKYNAPLIAIPISYGSYEADDKVLQQTFFENRNTILGLRQLITPITTIKKISRCRLVITATFHAAVFALAQGIPVIGLASSEMYINKFQGLMDQFGEGCQIVSLEDEYFQENLIDKIDKIWVLVEELKPQLLETARRQVDAGRTAYQHIYNLIK